MPESAPNPAAPDAHAPTTPYAAWLDGHRTEVTRRRDAAAAAESRWSLARLGAFIVAVAAWYPVSAALPAGAAAVAGGALAIVGGVVLFVAAVRTHLRHKAGRDALDRELLMIEESLSRAAGAVVLLRSRERPGDDGNAGPEQVTTLPPGRSWPLTDQERDDLDLYSAPVGLFGLLNRTSTEPGARRLRELIEAPLIDSAGLAERQAAVRYLAENGPARLPLMAAAASLRSEARSLKLLQAALRAVAPLETRIPLSVLRGWSVIAAAGIIVCLSQVLVGTFAWGLPLTVLLVVNGALFYPIRDRVRAQLDIWQSVQPALAGLSAVARAATDSLPAAPAQREPAAPRASGDIVLPTLRQHFAAAAAETVLPALARRVGWTEHGGLMHELFNLVGLYDVHIAAGLLRHAVPGRDAAGGALAALADLEALCSLAAFAAEQPNRCWPELSTERGIEIVAGCHALLDPRSAVPNSLHLSPGQRLWVVTGSNMAGKSTFLRMTAVNVMLAQIGTAAVAERMRWSPVRLITDLRTRDNLAKSESYFLAEVRHLRRMICPPDDSTPVLGLIDEPLRGTNSAEQIAASLAVVEHLIASGHFFMVATHDQKITELAGDDRPAQNYHFEERLDGNGLSFDYRLRSGPARTRNALRVLQQEGFPPDLMARAHDWLRASEEPSSDGRAAVRAGA